MLMSSKYNTLELCLKTVPLFADYGQFYYFLLSMSIYLFISLSIYLSISL